MSFEKSVPSEFGLILPRDNGMYWRKQGGGFSCTQYSLEGIYVPIGRLTHRLGYPDWAPESPDFEEKLRDISIDKVSERDQKSFPRPVRERGYFETTDEYFNWVEESEWYGHIELWDDLYRFTYGMFDLLDSDPRERWDSEDELWQAIDSTFSFRYKELSYDEYQAAGFEDYPSPEPAIRPIRIKGSEESRSGKPRAPWAEEISGEIVFLLCPNSE